MTFFKWWKTIGNQKEQDKDKEDCTKTYLSINEDCQFIITGKISNQEKKEKGTKEHFCLYLLQYFMYIFMFNLFERQNDNLEVGGEMKR